MLRLLCFLLPSIAGADGAALPEIEDCGAIATNRALPVYELRNTRLEQPVRGPAGSYDCAITLALKNCGQLLLLGYLGIRTEEGDWDAKDRVDWDFVYGRKLALGWLAGATNLLLITWQDVSESHGTGHYVKQHFVIAMVAPAESSVLLQMSTYVGGRSPHVSKGCGLGTHYFSFDTASQTLMDRASFSRTLSVGEGDDAPPLHHAATEGDAAATHMHMAEINEVVFFKYRVLWNQVVRGNVSLFYRTQPGDSAGDIARFYLGAMAPASAIYEANPSLREKAVGKSDYETSTARWPAETLVKIPVSEEWIRQFYHQP